MNRTIVSALYRKEMMDILRDKKTILMMIVVPLLLYPLLFIGSLYITSSILSSSTTDTYVIGFENVRQEEDFVESFRTISSKLNYNFAFYEAASADETMESAFENGSLDVYITENNGKAGDYRIVYNSADNASSSAAGNAEKILEEYSRQKQIELLEQLNIDPDSILHAVRYELEDHATNEETVGSLFGYIIPFLLVTSILMGAMYPAIDCTAGEKERGTLETLLTLPVTNLELITSKFLATASVAIAAAFLNVISMGILGGYFLESMQSAAETALSFDIAVYIPALLVMLLLAVILALFASAICLCVCIFARSFKEAQNYTTPVMLVFMLAAMACMLPGMKPEGAIAFLPVVNVVTLISELFQFEFVPAHIMTVLLSNLSYSILAILLMTRMFHSEEILFGDSNGGIRLLEKRSQMKEKQLPGIGDVILLLTVLVLVVLIAGSLLVVKLGIWGLVLQQLLIAACCLGYCWYIKTDFDKVFRFRKVNGWHLLAGILCWFGTYVIMLILSSLLSMIFPESAESANTAMTKIWEGQPLWLIMVSTALLPAICEELAFRGFLFGTLSNKYRPAAAIAWTGFLFGLYHMNLVKLVVVGFLGAMLAYVVYKSGSIWISMLIHFLNNLFSVLVSERPEMLQRILPVLFEENLKASQMWILIVLGIAALLMGIILLKWQSGDFRKKEMKQ